MSFKFAKERNLNYNNTVDELQIFSYAICHATKRRKQLEDFRKQGNEK